MERDVDFTSNLLSEAAMSQTVLHQHDNPRNYIDFSISAWFIGNVQQYNSL